MRIKIPIQIIELESDNFHIIVSSVFFNGFIGNWVIDTGASKTIFDKTLLEYYSVLNDESDEIHTAGIQEKPVETLMAMLKSVQFGKLKIDELKVALLDLSHINRLYSKATNIKICGLIGGDLLMNYKGVIDYKKQVLILYD